MLCLLFEESQKLKMKLMENDIKFMEIHNITIIQLRGNGRRDNFAFSK